MDNRWRIYKFWKMGMSLVTYQVDTVDTIEEAFGWAQAHGIKENKKRGILIKREGDKRRIYDYDDYYEYFGWKADYRRKPDPPPPPESEAPPEPTMEQLPLLEAPNPFRSIWRAEPPTKRRL